MNVPKVTILSENDETRPAAQLSVAAPAFQPIDWRWAALLAVIAVACFHTAYAPARSGLLAFGIVGYVVGLVQLARLRTTRQCFNSALVTGFACVAPQLECFWRIFGAFAIALWLILALWLAFFVVLTHLAIVRLGMKRAAWLTPFFWTGLEYFRSELYYLKFSWLNVGYAFAEFPIGSFYAPGVYGVGFVVAACAAPWLVTRRKSLLIGSAGAAVLIAVLPYALAPGVISSGPVTPQLAGVQLEFPDAARIREALDKVRVARPNADVFVLSEYTLDGEPADELKSWCRQHQKFLIVGGKDTSPGTNYYNTAFVISPDGEIVFKQVKSVPIQFFKDGLPAPEQKLWESPWGRIGICICYDLSYTRVTDELVRQGAQMLIVPTMDVADWGRHQHELHARIAPVRAVEYGIPIFRVASSGISQGVDRFGRIRATASFPGEGETIFFGARLGQPGRVPWDRYLAQLSVLVTVGFALWLAACQIQRKRSNSVAAEVTRR